MGVSAETRTGIEQAIAAHLADVDEGVLTDWFIAYGSMRHDPDTDDGISYGIHYATSNTSPHGALGIGTLGVRNLTDDLAYPDEDDDE